MMIWRGGGTHRGDAGHLEAEEAEALGGGEVGAGPGGGEHQPLGRLIDIGDRSIDPSSPPSIDPWIDRWRQSIGALQ